MSVRFRLALTVLLTGVMAAMGVIVTGTLALRRFEHQNTWQRADAFLARVVEMHDDLLDQQQLNPVELRAFLKSLVLYEPDSQLYLLNPDGRVLAHSGEMDLRPDFAVAIAPVRKAATMADLMDGGDRSDLAYVMGDDPQQQAQDAVIAARSLRRAQIRPSDAVAGYLYLVSHEPGLPGRRGELFRSSLTRPALGSVLAVLVLTTALTAWIIATVTRPLRGLSDEVAAAALEGFSPGSAVAVPRPLGPVSDDEFGRLRSGFHALLAQLRMQWDELRRLDHFRRESVSNLSHDLRSPLTATVACLETLEQRWAADPARAEDRQLVEVALRNTRNAAGLVRSLGDLALLDEPEFKLRPMRLDLAEVLDDISLRFAERARQRGIRLGFEQRGDQPPLAEVDIELLERALANLLDNALKFTPSEGAIVLSVEKVQHGVRIGVSDTGAGIPAHDLPHLFDRHYQSRDSAAPASSDEGKGLGLAIVKRIVELHRGIVQVRSQPGRGTQVTIELPAV